MVKTYLKIFVFILIFTSSTFSAQSKLLSFLGDAYKKLGLPTFTEYAWVVNAINVYEKTAGFVRGTNQLIRSFRSIYNEQREMQKKIEAMWGRVQKIYSTVDLYNTDTWATSLSHAQTVIRWDCADLLFSLNLIDYYTIGATETYINSLDSVFSYDYNAKKNIKTVENYYLGNDYSEIEHKYLLIHDDYLKSTLTHLKFQLENEKTILMDANSPENLKISTQKRINDLETKIIEIEQQAFKKSQSVNKLDSLIKFTSELISYNMTEIQVIEYSITDFEYTADILREKYNVLTNGALNSKFISKSDIGEETVKFTGKNIYGTHADLVPIPSKPIDSERLLSKLKGKDISNHDILHLQNVVEYITLRQETLLRDIAIIKAKTMAMLTVVEAYKRQKGEINAFNFVHDAQKLSISLEELL
jgi:hypothetical protein